MCARLSWGSICNKHPNLLHLEGNEVLIAALAVSDEGDTDIRYASPPIERNPQTHARAYAYTHSSSR